MDHQEEWRAIPGWEGLYEVSCHGRIRSVRRLVRINSFTPGRKRWMGGKIRKPQTIKDGYLAVTLTGEGRKRERMTVHKAVLLAFKGAPASGQVARHLNGNPSDNWPGNLAWGSHEENMADRKRHGNYKSCDKHSMAKLTPEQVRFIRESELTGVAVSTLLGIGTTQVSRIRRGENWRELA